MPLYEYFCKTCDDTFELLQPMGQMKLETTCPEGHGRAQKVLSVFASVTRGEAGGAEACASPTGMPMGGCGATACCMN